MKHILLIDEDAFLLDIYKTKFEIEKFKVTTARDGEAGFRILKKKKPDLVILDILLPKMDGFAVLEAIKKDAQSAGIPVIIFTSLGQKQDVDKGFELGAFDYLIKSHNQPVELVEAVKKAIQK